MSAAEGEFKMVACARRTQHHSVESVVIVEASDDVETKTATVHFLRTLDIADRSGDSQVMRHDGR
jgi:hypothetical protein